jgi:hypothetical protein
VAIIAATHDCEIPPGFFGATGLKERTVAWLGAALAAGDHDEGCQRDAGRYDGIRETVHGFGSPAWDGV